MTALDRWIPKSQNRYYGLDVVRFLSMVAIVQFHMLESFFYQDQEMFTRAQSWQVWLHPYSRVLAFSGFTIIALSSFLIGWHVLSTKKWSRLLLLMWAGLFCIASLEAGKGQWFYFEWDIYPYLLVTFTVIFLLQSYRKLFGVLAVISFVLLFLPVWDWAHSWSLHGLLRDATFGDCTVSGKGGWALIPWAGMAIFFFELGRWCRESNTIKAFLAKGARWEIPVWTVGLLASIPSLGAYYLVPLGPGFSCFVMRKPPIVLWAHLIWIIFFCRLSFLTVANIRLEKNPFVRLISRSYWSRHFGLCYALQFLWLEIGYPYVPYFEHHPHALDLFFLSIMPATEILARITWFCLKSSEAILRKLQRNPV